MPLWRRRRPEPEPEPVEEPPEQPRAERAGELPADGEANVADVPLGHGRRVKGLFWATDGAPERPGAVWAALAASFPETGLWPVLLTIPGPDLDPIDGGAWEEEAARDPEEVLREQWREVGPEDEGDRELAPFGPEFPGTGRGGERVDGAAAAAVAAMEKVAALALVAVRRPAEAPAAMGWGGAGNWYDDWVTPSAILHGWEERYDAILVGLGYDTMHLAVRRPPATEEDVLKAAAERYAFCPDQVSQGAESIRNLARTYVEGERHWEFWWD